MSDRKKELTSNLPQESYVKYSNCLPEQFNDFNFWKPRVPFLEEIDADLEEIEQPVLQKVIEQDKS
jgi:hypothetical protein